MKRTLMLIIIIIVECGLFINFVSTSNEDEPDCSGFSIVTNLDQMSANKLLDQEDSWMVVLYNVFKLRSNGGRITINDNSKKLFACALKKMSQQESHVCDLAKDPLEEEAVSLKLFKSEKSYHTFPAIKCGSNAVYKPHSIYFIKGNIARKFLENVYNVYVVSKQLQTLNGPTVHTVSVVVKKVPF